MAALTPSPAATWAASSEAKRTAAREAGAHETVDYRAVDLREAVMELTGGRGADVIFDPVGGDAFEASLRALAPDESSASR